jgi:hypothetical protein
VLHNYRTDLLSSDTWLIHSSPVQTKAKRRACIIECSVDEPVAAHRRCTQRLCFLRLADESSVLVIQSSKPYPPSFQFQPARRELGRFNRRRRSCAQRKDMPAPKLMYAAAHVVKLVLFRESSAPEPKRRKSIHIAFSFSFSSHLICRRTRMESMDGARATHTHTRTRGDNNKKKKLQTTTPSQALVSALQLQLQACSRRPPADQLGPQHTRW